MIQNMTNLSHGIRFLDPLSKENNVGNVIYFKATEKITVQMIVVYLQSCVEMFLNIWKRTLN